MVQWVRLVLPKQGAQVPSLVRKLEYTHDATKDPVCRN